MMWQASTCASVEDPRRSTTATAVTASLLLRFYEYTRERFPLRQFVPLSIAVALPSALGTQTYLFGHLDNLAVTSSTSAAVFLLLLRLRLIDELKDLEHDRRFHADRPVSRGLIQPGEVARLAFAAFLLETLVAATAGTWALAFFAGLAAYSLLTANEFFIRSWLRRHFTAYVISHEVLLVPFCFYLFSLSGLTLSDLARPYFWLLTIFTGCQVFLLEVARKLRPKELDTAAHDTYTARYGIGPACVLAGLLALGSVVTSVLAAGALGGGVGVAAGSGLILLGAVLRSLLAFADEPSLRSAKATLGCSAALVLGTSALFTLTVWFAA
jgi:hypothetical protein